MPEPTCIVLAAAAIVVSAVAIVLVVVWFLARAAHRRHSVQARRTEARDVARRRYRTEAEQHIPILDERVLPQVGSSVSETHIIARATPRQFEALIAWLMLPYGNPVELTPYIGDSGVDVWVYRNDEKFAAVQAKHVFFSDLHFRSIEDFLSCPKGTRYRAQGDPQCLVIATSGDFDPTFMRKIHALSMRISIILWDRQLIIEKLEQLDRGQWFYLLQLLGQVDNKRRVFKDVQTGRGAGAYGILGGLQ